MSHKTHPTSLRLLYSNTNFTSAWFSEVFYKETLLNEWRTRAYLQAFLKITGCSELTPLICIQSYYRICRILYIAHDTRGTRREKEFRFWVRGGAEKGKEKTEKSPNRKNQQLSITTVPPTPTFPEIEKWKLFYQTVRSSLQYAKLGTLGAQIFDPTQAIGEKFTPQVAAKLKCSNNNNNNNNNNIVSRVTFRTPVGWCKIEGAAFYLKERLFANNRLQFLSEPNNSRVSLDDSAFERSGIRAGKPELRMCCNFDFVRVLSDLQNACSLIDEIVNLLEKRVLWRRIKQTIFRELELNEFVHGIRLCFSGRLGSGGASKKAQKSKVETHSCGVIALNAFSSRVSFASKSADTPFGKIGVRVWIAFK